MMSQNNFSIEYLDSIDSTNSEIKRRLLAGEDVAEYSVLCADEQTAGRGRSGHEWQTPKGTAIATSMAVYPEGLCSDAVPLITILGGIAVTRTLEEYGLAPMIKWPNDVLLNEKKVSGILSEQIISEGGQRAVIIGIGINIFPESYGPQLESMATSIYQEMEKNGPSGTIRIRRKDLVRRLWEHFIGLYEQFKKDAGILFILKEYNDHLINRQRRICIESQENGKIITTEATAVKMNSMGALVIKKDDGTTESIDSGEVHIKGVYGYV